LSAKTKGCGSLPESNEAKASSRDITLLLGLLKSIRPVRAKHALLGPKNSPKIAKLLLSLLGLKRPVSLSRRQPKTGVQLLRGHALTSAKLKRTLSSSLIGQGSLKVGSLIESSHILSVRDVELPSLHTRGLIGQSSLKRRLLIGPRGLKTSANIKLTSLKRRSRIGLLTRNVRTKHIRSQRLTRLLGPQKLLVNLLGNGNVLSRALTSRTSPSQSLTSDASRAFQTARTSRHLSGSLRGSTKLLSRKLPRSRSPRQPLRLKSLTQRANLLVAQSLLIEGFTKSPSAHTLSGHLTSGHTLSRYALRRKGSCHLKLLSRHLLRSEARRSRKALRTDGLSLRSLHGKPPHLIQVAAHLATTKLSSLTQSRRHFGIGGKIGLTGLRSIGPKLS
jgi:hypothetical protein